MMKLFRNTEFVKVFVLYCILGTVAAVIGFVFELEVGIFVLTLSIIFLLIFVISTYRRYVRIADLASDINKILHGNSFIPLERYSEGELAILQSEICKMTVRLREQQQTLQDDKVYLADSLADISHQIRTPLTSINLLVNFLTEPNISDERRRMLSHELYSLLSRIDWLITALLKISKLDAGTVQFKSEQTTLDDLIRRSAAPVAVPMELREQILDIQACGEFHGDISWTCEAITNIVKNCMEHTPDGGTIRICASENALYSEIVISDNGCGISEEDLPHIFERFYKGADSDKNSFGIGLALARKIITVQNGTVKAGNSVTNGAEFTIRFYKRTV